MSINHQEIITEINKNITTIITVILIIFTFFFYYSSAYFFAFLTLVLLLISPRVNDIKKIKVSFKNVDIEFRELNKELKEVIQSKNTLENKLKGAKKILSNMFKLGCRIGEGKALGTISDVKMIEDEEGNITVQYDES
ncbi:hypothetical protein GYA49_00220 [Candidatus Beckwithbacteria bacterium]|nr:hypothetical protein [Candidatus Beckwithbacteria bacterium]